MAKKQYIVIGLGRFGFSLAKTLYESGADVIAIDKDMNLVNEIEPYCSQAIGMDSTDDKALAQLDIGGMDEAIVCIAKQLEASVFICLNLLRMGIRVTAKAQGTDHKIILERLGVHHVLIPEKEMGIKMAHMLLRPQIANEVFWLSDKFSIVEITPPKSWLGKSAAALKLRALEGINVIAIKRGKNIISDITGDTGFEPTDTVLVCGNSKDTNRLSKR